MSSPHNSSISRLNNQSLLVSKGLQPSSASLWPFSGLSLLHPFLSCSGQPKPGHNTPGVLSPRLSRKEGSPLLAQGTIGSCSTTFSSAFTGKVLSSQTGLMLFGELLGVHFSSRSGLSIYLCLALGGPDSFPSRLRNSIRDWLPQSSEPVSSAQFESTSVVPCPVPLLA